MIKLEEALEIIEKSVKKTMSTESIGLLNSRGRILAADIYSDMDFPSFDKSAMDGYAIKQQDIEKELEPIEFIPAGKMPEKKVESGQCSKIMTGAMLPAGSDMVVKVEDTQLIDGKVKVVNLKSKGNVLFRGEDIKSGNVVLHKYQKLTSVHTGIMASVGMLNPEVFKKPVLSVLSTGSELVLPEEKPLPPQIRNSNSTQLQSLAYECGAEVSFVSQIEDDEEKILANVKTALEKSDIVVLTGGASFGDLDFSQKVFESLNAKIQFTTLAIQPGKPCLFATIGDKFLFGLSGNPVSSFVQFQLLVKPLIKKLSAIMEEEIKFKLPITKEMKRKRAERNLFFPVFINNEMAVQPVEYHGSAHLNAYQNANAMASFSIGKDVLQKGELVDVRPI
ncbi:MAG: hypothetical protein C0595_14920 [Marinilabiliales bacterium]|nr:MAG: hypothetical protein C0595_14920 [Marinilabiliales bacterium]